MTYKTEITIEILHEWSTIILNKTANYSLALSVHDFLTDIGSYVFNMQISKFQC
jgi:hypothetical protein